MGAQGAGSNPVQLYADPSIERMPLKAELGSPGNPSKRTVGEEKGGRGQGQDPLEQGCTRPTAAPLQDPQPEPCTLLSLQLRPEELGPQDSGCSRLCLCPYHPPALPGPSSPSPGSGGQRQAAGVQSPSTSPNRSHLTLQQDSQESDSGQKSHLVLHGAGSSTGPGWCVKRVTAELFWAPVCWLSQEVGQERKTGPSPRPFSGEGA